MIVSISHTCPLLCLSNQNTAALPRRALHRQKSYHQKTFVKHCHFANLCHYHKVAIMQKSESRTAELSDLCLHAKSRARIANSFIELYPSFIPQDIDRSMTARCRRELFIVVPSWFAPPAQRTLKGNSVRGWRNCQAKVKDLLHLPTFLLKP